jgi:hypothetical protein
MLENLNRLKCKKNASGSEIYSKMRTGIEILQSPEGRLQDSHDLLEL